MNILLLYNATCTFTNAIFEHVEAFARFSSNRFFFCHHDENAPLNVDLSAFDAVGIHYSDRVAWDQISADASQRLNEYSGLKFLFVQDEYERTHRTWYWIRQLRISLVFTVVPPGGIDRVYPQEQFPGVRFVSNLTGYVPEGLPSRDLLRPPSSRDCLVGYRGRPLPLLQLGALAREKVLIGEMVKAYCTKHGLPSDIAWDEDARIYGAQWYEFVGSCRSVLGTESGSNVFDWDGTLQAQVATWRAARPGTNEQDAYQTVVAPREQHGLMNQVSPRIFEAIGLGTALVLFEGNYSGVIRPWDHYIPLRKDGSNLEEVFLHLRDGEFVDAMVERAYRDVIGSGVYAYEAFIEIFDQELQAALAALPPRSGRQLPRQRTSGVPTLLTTGPVRAVPPGAPQPSEAALLRAQVGARLKNLVVMGWHVLPPAVRPLLRPIARKGFLPAWRWVVRSAGRLLR